MTFTPEDRKIEDSDKKYLKLMSKKFLSPTIDK